MTKDEYDCGDSVTPAFCDFRPIAYMAYLYLAGPMGPWGWTGPSGKMLLDGYYVARLPRLRFSSPYVNGISYHRTIQTEAMDVTSTKRRDRSLSTSENPMPAKKLRQDGSSSASHIATAEATKAPKDPRKPNPKKSKLSKRALGKLIHPEEGTPDDVLWHEIRDTLGDTMVDDAIAREVDLESPLKFGDILELDVEKLSSNGVCNPFSKANVY